MDLDQRVGRLEVFAEDVKQRLARIEARLDVIEALLKHLASKADIAILRAEMLQMENRMLRWFVGTAVALSTVVFAVAKLIH